MRKEIFLIGLGVILLAALPAAAQGTCPSMAGIEAARKTGDLGAYGRLVAAADTTCSPAERSWVGRTAAIDLVKAARHRSGAEREALLAEAVRYGRPWQLLVVLAGDAEAGDNFAQAAELYQSALDNIADASETPNPPPEAEIRRYMRLASQNRLLSEGFQPTSVRRDGTDGGLRAPSVRGTVALAEPIPITFDSNTTTFTDKGRLYADDLVESLKDQKITAITLTGHTDRNPPRNAPQTSDAYNCALSRDRLEAVAQHLRANGYDGTVRLVPLGLRSPAVIENPTRYTQDQVDLINRRVEWARDKNAEDFTNACR